jgi:predicted nucleic-acid-binding protein
MLAVDTSVVVRLLTQDDRTQAVQANSIFAIESVWIAKTVLLETEWILRSCYGFSAENVRGALALLLGLPNVRVEDEATVTQAHALMSKGIDFSDGLHLASRPPGSAFFSFDEKFARRAKRAGVTGVTTASSAS